MPSKLLFSFDNTMPDETYQTTIEQNAPTPHLTSFKQKGGFSIRLYAYPKSTKHKRARRKIWPRTQNLQRFISRKLLSPQETAAGYS